MTLVWLNGRLAGPEDAQVSVADRGLLLGDGVFETMPVYQRRVFDLDAHLKRLAAGLDVLGFAGFAGLSSLPVAIAQYVAAEGMDSAVLRLTITRGPGPRGLAPPDTPHPTTVMTLSPMPPARTAPVSLHVATATRRNEFSALSRIKALPYLDNVLALREARAHGADDALMLNTRGTIACAAAANIFAIRGRHLLTPPLSGGALPGTMRALVLSLADAAGLVPAEDSLEIYDLAEADGVFLTNSISRVTEAKDCNGTPLARRGGAALDRLRTLIQSRFDAP